MVYNLIGGALWVGIFCYAGYFFGDLPFVQKNLKLLIVAIIVVSILPAVIEVGRNKWKTRPLLKSNISKTIYSNYIYEKFFF